jgi:hypothetical protein
MLIINGVWVKKSAGLMVLNFAVRIGTCRLRSFVLFACDHQVTAQCRGVLNLFVHPVARDPVLSGLWIPQ